MPEFFKICICLFTTALVEPIIFAISVHEAAARRHNFGMLNDAYIRIVDVNTKREILRYDLDAEFTDNTDMLFGKLQKVNNECSFVATGLGSNDGLQGYVDKYA